MEAAFDDDLLRLLWLLLSLWQADLLSPLLGTPFEAGRPHRLLVLVGGVIVHRLILLRSLTERSDDEHLAAGPKSIPHLFGHNPQHHGMDVLHRIDADDEVLIRDVSQGAEGTDVHLVVSEAPLRKVPVRAGQIDVRHLAAAAPHGDRQRSDTTSEVGHLAAQLQERLDDLPVVGADVEPADVPEVVFVGVVEGDDVPRRLRVLLPPRFGNPRLRLVGPDHDLS